MAAIHQVSVLRNAGHHRRRYDLYRFPLIRTRAQARLRNRLQLEGRARPHRRVRRIDSAEGRTSVLAALTHIANMMLSVELDAELGHQIELGLEEVNVMLLI